MFHTKTNKYIAKGALGVLAFTSLAFATTLADDYLYVNATHLNVRAAGTFRSAIVATVDNGYKVTVLATQENGWKKVLLENGAEGYVNGKYLAEQAPYYEKALGSNYTVSVPSAFVRAEGLVRKVAVLHKGDRLEVLDEKVFLGKWLRVRVLSSTHGRYNDRVGYISKKLVNVAEGSQFMATEEVAPTEEAITTEDAATLEDLGLNSAPAEEVATPATETATESADDAELGDLLGGLLE